VREHLPVEREAGQTHERRGRRSDEPTPSRVLVGVIEGPQGDEEKDDRGINEDVQDAHALAPSKQGTSGLASLRARVCACAPSAPLSRDRVDLDLRSLG
jgi:hypothetical protein